MSSSFSCCISLFWDAITVHMWTIMFFYTRHTCPFHLSASSSSLTWHCCTRLRRSLATSLMWRGRVETRATPSSPPVRVPNVPTYHSPPSCVRVALSLYTCLHLEKPPLIGSYYRSITVMRRAQSTRHHGRPSTAQGTGGADDLSVLKETEDTVEDSLRKQLLEKDRENDKVRAFVPS